MRYFRSCSRESISVPTTASLPAAAAPPLCLKKRTIRAAAPGSAAAAGLALCNPRCCNQGRCYRPAERSCHRQRRTATQTAVGDSRGTDDARVAAGTAAFVPATRWQSALPHLLLLWDGILPVHRRHLAGGLAVSSRAAAGNPEHARTSLVPFVPLFGAEASTRALSALAQAIGCCNLPVSLFVLQYLALAFFFAGRGRKEMMMRPKILSPSTCCVCSTGLTSPA